MRASSPDPTDLYRAREGIFADDLLLVAVGWLDLFTWLLEHDADQAGLCEALGLSARPVDVLCTLLRAVGLLEPGEPLRPTPRARCHLIAGSPSDLRPYFQSLRERPTCRQLLEVLSLDPPS